MSTVDTPGQPQPTWREAYDARDCAGTTDLMFDSASFGDGGRTRLIATPIQYIDGYGTWHKGPFAMVVRDEAVVLVKKAFLAGTKTVLTIPILNFRRYAVGLQGGHGPLYEFYSELNEGGSITFLFMTASAAEDTAEYVNSGVLFKQ